VGLRVQPFVGGLIGGEDFFFLLESIVDSLSLLLLSFCGLKIPAFG
jgi:hypothetical protein